MHIVAKHTLMRLYILNFWYHQNVKFKILAHVFGYNRFMLNTYEHWVNTLLICIYDFIIQNSRVFKLDGIWENPLTFLRLMYVSNCYS